MKTFSSQGKVRGIFPKILENGGNFSQFFFSDFLIEVDLLNRSLHLLNSFNEMLKKYWKVKETYWKSPGYLSVRKCAL